MSFDFDAAVGSPFRMQPGLRRLAPRAAQLTPLQPGSRHQREKLAVLSAYAGQALLQREGFDAGPALAALCAHAAAEHPDAFAWDGRRAHARRLGIAVAEDEIQQLAAGTFGLGDEVPRCLQALPAGWRLAGLLSLAFEEDFAIVDGHDGSIPWLAVALPSHWAPEDKVGRHFTAVHAPVADNALLLTAAERLIKLVTGHERWERFVWTITSHPWLHAHPARLDHERWPPGPPAREHGTELGREAAGPDDRAHAERIAALAWFRTERQTFIPLPALQQAVFTIHVQLQPLALAIHSPERAARLHDAVATMSDAVLAYRGLGAVREPLLAWLHAQSLARPVQA